jgi:hypothetical protein
LSQYPLGYLGYLPHGLSLAEYDFGKAYTQIAVMIDARKLKVFVRKPRQPVRRLVDAYSPRPRLFE